MTSSQLSLSFTINQLGFDKVKTLSVFDDKLLVSFSNLTQLFIYSREGRHLSTIPTNIEDWLMDVTWTPRGNIVFTTCITREVVVMSESSKVINTHKQMKNPGLISVSDDSVIYLADWQTGVYQSSDDGASWGLVFNSTAGWHCWQVIKVSTDYSDDFWTLEASDNKNYHLRVYRRYTDGKMTWRDIDMTWRDIDVPITDGKHIDLSGSRLSYDGNMNIFLNESNNNAVHLLSMNGQYYCQLLSPHHLENKPYSLAVDNVRQLLYVGQEKGLVKVFKLTYGDNGE